MKINSAFRRVFLLGLACFGSTFSLFIARADDFQGLGFVPGSDWSDANGISADGTTVVGYGWQGNVQAFRWQNGIMTGLGYLPGNTRSVATATDADGMAVVGYSSNTDGTARQAFLWTATSGMIGLGYLPGGNFSEAYGTNSDGGVVVGTSGLANQFQAFRWTSAGGMVAIGGNGSVAHGTNSDGSVIVGWSNDQAFRWTPASGMIGLGYLPGDNRSYAWATNSDGSVAVGFSRSSASPTVLSQAFRWTAASGMIGLGFLPGGTNSEAYATNADGSVVVGVGNSVVAGHINPGEAFRWTQSQGMQSIRSLLQSAGVDLTGWALLAARGVSADGQVMTGSGVDPQGRFQAWIARFGGSIPGLVTPSDLMQSLKSLQGSVESSHGALNAGLGTLTEIAAHHGCGSTCVTAYGLYRAERGPSFDDRPDYNGTIGVAKAFGRDFSAGLTISIGEQHDILAMGSSDRQRTLSGGVHAAYIPDQGLQLIAGAIVSHIDAEIERAYHNGNTPVTSSGNTSGMGLGIVARFGWAARPLFAFRIMPFVDYEITRVHYNSYSETAGPFPANINILDDTQQRIRIGGEVRYAFNSGSYLWGSVALGHRLTGMTASISGASVGLFDLTVPGSTVSRDWIESVAGLRIPLSNQFMLTVSVSERFSPNSTATANLRVGLTGSF